MTGPVAGDIWRYPYLWARQSEAGEIEGRKSRPTAVIAVVRTEQGSRHVALLPITTQPPAADRQALAIPQTEARRAGLTIATPLWVMVDEFNTDRIETSWYFEPGGRIGAFGTAFTVQVSAAFRAALAQRRSRKVRRDL